MHEFILLPCPFCGSEAEFVRFGSKIPYDVIRCTGCYCQTDAIIGGLKSGVESWNNRVTYGSPAPVQKLKNERGAGRKPKISDIDKQRILDFVSRGSSYRSTAHYFKVSLGTVHKLINEHEKIV
ncbi:MAG: Lar family restriction alleviation protein [Defluviitaleaceae bacterium]|nr:Lar family restriction alleviation protein [Defluviitaleaceae bacterium]MCL2262750.1 Lar family restriction alleviation protein [Defluviitaleaceae bacterium]